MNRRFFLKATTATPLLERLASARFASRVEAQTRSRQMTVLQTPSGVRFGLLGRKQAHPAPTCFIFSSTAQASLENEVYVRVGWILAEHGFLSVSLDLPCHGDGRAANDGLACWRRWLEEADNFLPGFLSRLSSVLDFLIRQGYTDPARIAACGTSRGGFIALHFAAADPRVSCVAAFSPVTNLLTLREFAGMEMNEPSRSLALVNIASKLANRPLWIAIGNNDHRVGTDNAIQFTQGLMEAAAAQKRAVKVELHIGTSEGHHTPANAHEEAAKWILGQFYP